MSMEKSPQRTRLQKLLPSRRTPLPFLKSPLKRQNRQHQEHRPSTTKTRPPTPRPRVHPQSRRERLPSGPIGDVPRRKSCTYRAYIGSSLVEIMARDWV